MGCCVGEAEGEVGLGVVVTTSSWEVGYGKERITWRVRTTMVKRPSEESSSQMYRPSSPQPARAITCFSWGMVGGRRDLWTEWPEIDGNYERGCMLVSVFF